MLDNGASCVNKFSVKINLSEDKQILLKNLRKSYKPLINKGLRNFTHTLLTSDNISISDIENFRQLHYEVSGRRTRSHASWLLQYDAIKNKQAFM